MPLTKYSPSSPARNSTSSSSGFHPFGGRISKHFGDSVSPPRPPSSSLWRDREMPRHPIRSMLLPPKFATRRSHMADSPLQLSPEEAYLSYHDVRLTREDINCIKNDWLTDNVIAFWEEYLEREKLIHYPRANIILLRPSMSFLLMKTPDPLTLKSALPDFEKTTHIFLPINDCYRVDVAEGGSHWSLLLVSLIDGVSFHYDSLTPNNYREGQLVSTRFSQLLGRPLRYINLDDAPQQENGMDCGVYVCLLMSYLLMHKLLRAHSQDKVSMSMRGKEVDAAGGRKAMLRLIEERRQEGERRRSRSQSPHVGPSSGHRRGKSKSRSPPRIGEENEGL